jgi:uncharacterized repeat protein (TIGR03803 family)
MEPMGAAPTASLIRDAAGTIYGTTTYGGNFNCLPPYGCGVVFKLDGRGKETVLHTFTGGADGAQPQAALIEDTRGNLYGTTAYGGNLSCNPPYGCGVVFKLKAARETVLHAFTGPPDGANPMAGLIVAPDGKLYGTTANGGDANCPDTGTGCGVVFELDSPKRSEIVLYSFIGGDQDGDGSHPFAGLFRDNSGNLYGTTYNGGRDFFSGAGFGVIFEIDKAGVESILYRFSGLSDGANPAAGLITLGSS